VSPTRRTTFLIAILIAVVTLTMTVPASAGTRVARGKMFHFVNHYRHQHNRHRLGESHDVDRIAQRHSAAMGKQRVLFHSSSLTSKLRAHDPSLWGENVGMSWSVWRVFKAWTRSSDHRANLLKRGYRKAGVGVVWSHGACWVTMIYFG
jgi:uncharacterized protein YkwD